MLTLLDACRTQAIFGMQQALERPLRPSTLICIILFVKAHDYAPYTMIIAMLPVDLKAIVAMFSLFR